VYVGGSFPSGSQSTAVFVHLNETAGSAGGYTGYHLYVDAPRRDVAVDLSGGLGRGPSTFVELGGTQLSVHGFFDLRDDLALVAGVVRTPWVSHVQLGARFRPTDHVDAGVGVDIPVLGGMGPQPVRSELVMFQPMLDVRVTR